MMALQKGGLVRLLVTLLMGFASGLPLVLTAGTLQAWYTVSNVDLVTIGFLTLVGQPYVYKFAWAPLLDRYRIAKMDLRRGWIVFFQICLAIALLIMAHMDPSVHPFELAVIAFAVATFSASQDIAIDAYRTDLLRPSERGMGAALYTTGYRFAMLLAGGLALVLAEKFGWKAMYSLMALCMVFNAIVTLLSPRSEKQNDRPDTLLSAMIGPFVEFLSRPKAISILLFILLYKIGDAFALSLTTPFLLKGIGFSLTDVGLIFKTVGLAASIGGGLVGGAWMMRMGLYKALWVFGIAQGLSTAMFIWLAVVGKSYALMMATIFLESFCGALGTVAFIALLMSLCDKRYTATQFALLSAFSAIGRVFIGPIAGEVVTSIGWLQFYCYAVLLALPGLVVLWYIRHSVKPIPEISGVLTN